MQVGLERLSFREGDPLSWVGVTILGDGEVTRNASLRDTKRQSAECQVLRSSHSGAAPRHCTPSTFLHAFTHNNQNVDGNERRPQRHDAPSVCRIDQPPRVGVEQLNARP